MTNRIDSPSEVVPLVGLAFGADDTTATPVDAAHPLPVTGAAAVISASFTRPADVTPYVSTDLVANSTTAGSVVPLSFLNAARAEGGSGMIRRARVRKSDPGITNASFRIHLYGASPTVTNGDNGTWLSNQVANYLGALDVTVDKVFSDGAGGNGAPMVGSEINFDLASGTTVYGLLEARGAYVPVSGETITVSIEVLQN